MEEKIDKIRIKTQIPRPKRKFYRQCEFKKDVFEAIKYFHYWKRKI